jgi:putative SOS response-associated peptidase YedK
MCGRYTVTQVDGRQIAERFGVREAVVEQSVLGRYNVCPTEPVPAICAADGGEPAVRTLRWGLVPPWARSLGAGYEPINARAETLFTRSPFASLAGRAERRCLVVADGWYEWLRQERPRGARLPFRYTVDDGGLFAFAGLWDVRRVGGEEVASACVATTAANDICAPVHDRMPCVLASPEAEAAWLFADLDAEAAAELLVPLDAARTTATPANPAVNRAGVEGPELLEPPGEPEEPAQLRLV